MSVENIPAIGPHAAAKPAGTATPARDTTPVPARAPEAPAKPQIQYDPKESELHLQEAISRLNDMMKSNNRNLAFSRDEALHTTVITVRNTQTGDVVRQIPNEAALRVAHSLEQLKGLFFNEKT